MKLNGTRKSKLTKLISAMAFLSLLCGVVSSADIAGAANLTIVGNQTTVSLTSFDFLTGAGFTIAPLPDAVVDTGVDPPDITFPITGGTVDTDTGFALIEHDNSGFSLAAGGQTVFFRNFLIDTEQLQLFGDTTVNMTTSDDYPLFDVAEAGDQFSLNLTSEAALLLDGVFDLNLDLTGTEIGLATVDVNAVPIPGAAFLLGSALLGLVGLKRKK